MAPAPVAGPPGAEAAPHAPGGPPHGGRRPAGAVAKAGAQHARPLAWVLPAAAGGPSASALPM
eukprot:13944224-Alexandrium_andersonii.AAC.1